MKKPSLVIPEVDDFIKRVDNGDLIITPEAREIMLTIPAGKNPWGVSIKEKHSLAELLSCAIGNYQVIKDSVRDVHSTRTNPLLRQALDSRLIESSDELLCYIKRARIYGVIEDRNLTNKLKECQEQNQRLKEKVDKLGKENQKLHEALQKFGKTGFVSDVTDNTEVKP